MSSASLSLISSLISSLGWPLRGLGHRVFGGTTFCARAPEDDLRFIDVEAADLGGLQARSLTDDTVDVGDGPAYPTHQVVMVVTGAGFIQRRRARRLDAAKQSGPDAA